MNPARVSEHEILVLTIYTCMAFLLMAGILILFFYFSRKKIGKIELLSKNAEILHQKELVNSILKTQEAERKRIAQDLHDDISSKLNIISLNTHLLLTENLNKTERKDIKNTIISYTKLVIEDSRRIAHDLLPPVLQNFGLHAGIEELCSELSKRNDINIQYSNQIIFDAVDSDKQLHVFRIVQELINNSIVHGKASLIFLNFEEKNQTTTLNFSDNGKGFTPNDTKIKLGMGTKNIESRVNFLNGNLKVTSEINKGVSYIINFKL